MTCYVVLHLAERFNLDVNTTLITISVEASQVTGTSAKLVAGDSFTIYQLLFGLMLPSGNDAAYAFAEYFGDLLIETTNE
jgi:D-alanyl-D-alanine carboxypeptidase (penicillin-binding protein 5/6)